MDAPILSAEDDFTLDDDFEDKPEVPEAAAELTPEQQAANDTAAAAERDRIAAENERKLKQFAPILEKLEASPERIFDVRAALAGQQQQQQQQQYAPPASLSPEQMQGLNDELTKAVLEGRGVAAIAQIAQAVSSAQYNQLLAQAQPIMSRTGETFVESYKSRKSREKLYDVVAATFDEELQDLDGASLVNMSPQRRQQELDRRYNAAVGRVLSQRVRSAPSKAANMASGGVPSPQSRGGLSDRERRVLQRGGLSEQEIREFEADRAREEA